MARRAVGAPTSASLHFSLVPKWLAAKEKAGAKREEFLIKAAPAQGAKGKARG